jgi:WD40 repeat protein
MTNWLTCVGVDVAQGLFAVGREDGTVILSELSTGRPLWVERLHERRVSAVVFDKGRLWTAGFDGIVASSGLTVGGPRLRFEAGHGGRVLSLRVGHGALATVGDDGHARLWDPATLKAVQALDERRYGPAYSVAVTPGWIAVGYEKGYVGIWKPSDPSAPVLAAGWQYEGSFQPAGRSLLYAIAVSPSGHLAAFARDRAVCLHEPGEWTPVARLPVPVACNDLQFNSNGTTLIGACSDREVRVWGSQPMEGSRHGHWPTHPTWLGEGMLPGEWRQELIYSGARFVGDDRVIASSFDGAVRLFPSRGPSVSPLRVARQGGDAPGGWES